ncbi:hypothetical protein ACI01nite_00890 [Acetobacter cibinongensis]|uniref:Outer membrane protein n=1 Tax=Acetobacter cibinongensis TaxID=146475 RepID=A0A0D6N205_9PROT|nr:Hint domain-containing protein [Acetobacter cibinongensis]GAN59598.1 outer membrane protein [Acetobacter cibinongensis]GEL57487.1 hypothetical protein ACI01nite_00890 [Acetobacter cibinongensis]
MPVELDIQGVTSSNASIEKENFHTNFSAISCARDKANMVCSPAQKTSPTAQVYHAVRHGVNVTVVADGVMTFGPEGTASLVGLSSALYVEAGAGVSHAVVRCGETLMMEEGSAIEDILIVEEGAHAVVPATAGGVIQLCGAENNSLILTGNKKSNLFIKGFLENDNADSITLSDVKAADIASLRFSDLDHVTLNFVDGQNFDLAVAGIGRLDPRKQSEKMVSYTKPVCFLAGTLLRTPKGDVPIEMLTPGDVISIYDVSGQNWETRKIIWSGSKRLQVRTDRPEDEAGYPVRILKNALAEGVPYKDMLVTSDHSLFFETMFVPVRMLVNGHSIFYDRTVSAYTYYHVETEHHSIIMADGALTESFLDTENQRLFYQTTDVVKLRCGRLTWERDGAVPRVTTRAAVEPVYHRLAERAQEKQFPCRKPAFDITFDPDLHLQTDQGQIVTMARKVGSSVMFMLPATVRNVKLCSRTSRKSDSIGPFVDDRREWGVLVGEIALLDTTRSAPVKIHLTTAELEGWADLESTEGRWTTGSAVLPLQHRATRGFMILSVKILAGGPYAVIASREEQNPAPVSAAPFAA